MEALGIAVLLPEVGKHLRKDPLVNPRIGMILEIDFFFHNIIFKLLPLPPFVKGTERRIYHKI